MEIISNKGVVAVNVKRYINGREVEKSDLQKIELDSEIITRTIAAVNRRIEEFQQKIQNTKSS